MNEKIVNNRLIFCLLLRWDVLVPKIECWCKSLSLQQLLSLLSDGFMERFDFPFL